MSHQNRKHFIQVLSAATAGIIARKLLFGTSVSILASLASTVAGHAKGGGGGGKPKASFTYQGRAIHPLALSQLMKTPSGDPGKRGIDLRSVSFQEPVSDFANEIILNKGKWTRSYLTDRDYCEYFLIGDWNGLFVVIVSNVFHSFEQTELFVLGITKGRIQVRGRLQLEKLLSVSFKIGPRTVSVDGLNYILPELTSK